MKRRDFIKTLPIGLAAASIPIALPGFTAEAYAGNPLLHALLGAENNSRRILVLINLSGGNDGLNTCIPFQNPQYDLKRPSLGFTTGAEKASLQNYLLRPDMALNPQLDSATGQSKFMKLWKDGKLGVVQSVGYPDGSRSHFRSTDIWNTASDSNLIVSTGWVGRYLEQIKPDYPLPVATGVMEGDDPLAMSIDFSPPLTFQGSKSMMGIAVNDPSDYQVAPFYADDTPPATNYGSELQYLRNVLIQSDVYGDRIKEIIGQKGTQDPPPTNNVLYPNGNRLAQQLKKVAWCIKANMKTKVYFVSLGGFDTHVQQSSKDPLQGHGLLMAQLSEAVALFQQDIELMGNDPLGVKYADRVIGMTYSEFGRRVEQNSSQGTDHGSAAPQFFFGNAINGELYGSHPSLTDLDIYADIKAQFDFRQLFAGVLTDWFGADDAVRKAVLNKPEFTSKTDFGFQFPVNGSSTMQSIIRPEFINPSSVRRQEIDRIFVLDQNFPNPVQNQTTIPFRLSESATVRLEIYDSRGELVATPVEALLGRGEHPVTFDARRLGNGKYFYRLDVNGVVETKSMMVVK